MESSKLFGKMVLCLCAMFVLLPAMASAQNQDADTTLRVFWKEGLRLETDDGQFKFKIGGRTAIDAAWFSDDDVLQQNFGEAEDGFKFRRAYLCMSGQIHDWVEF